MSRRGTAEEKTAKSDPIYRNRLVNMLVNRILKHGKKSLAYQIIYRAMKKIQQKTETNPLSVLRQSRVIFLLPVPSGVPAFPVLASA